MEDLLVVENDPEKLHGRHLEMSVYPAVYRLEHQDGDNVSCSLICLWCVFADQAT